MKWLWLLGVCAGVSACSGTPEGASVEAPRKQSSLLDHRENVAGPEPVTLDPNNYKEMRKRQALRGLRYEAQLVSLDPEAPVSVSGSAEQLFAEGQEFLRRNLPYDAIEAHTHAVLVQPGAANNYVGLAAGLSRKGWQDKALAAMHTAEKLGLDSADFQYAFGQHLQGAGQRQAAIARYEAAVQSNPNYGKAWQRLALARFFADDVQGAAAAAQSAEKLGVAMPPQFDRLLSDHK